MITIEDIKPGEIVKVLLSLDDVEEEHYARVIETSNIFIRVNYLLPTEKIYKGLCVYELDESPEIVEPESICEHYPDIMLFEDLDNLYNIPRTPYYVIQDDNPISSDDESVWETTDDDEYQEDDFCVNDNEIDGRVEPPPDHKEIDEEWDKWQPQTTGAKRFKERVELIEKLARQHADNLNF